METKRCAFWLGLVGTSLLAFGCDLEREEVREEREGESTVDNIAGQPTEFYGKRVTVVGEVGKFYGERAFALKDDMDIIFKDSVLVLTKAPVQFGSSKLDDADEVLVTGTIGRYETAKIKEHVDGSGDSVVEIERWKDQPVLIASSIRRISESGRWSYEDEPEGAAIGWSSIYSHHEPSQMIGDRVHLDTVEVQRVDGQGVWVGSPAFPVFTVVEGKQKFVPGDWVDVKGTVEAMPKENAARENWGLSPRGADELDQAHFYLKAKSIDKAARQPAWLTNAVALKEYAKDPSKYAGRAVTGEAEVTKNISGEAIYLKGDDGKEVLALLRLDALHTGAPKLSVGEKIRFTARAQKDADRLDRKREDMHKDVQQALEEAPGFLTIHRHDIFMNEGS